MVFLETHRLKWTLEKPKRNIISRFSISILILMVFLIQGCGVSYTVRVNGYLDPSRPVNIEPGTPIHIVEDTKAKNPLLEKEVAGKLVNMLKIKGCEVADPGVARYYMLYGYGIGQERTITSTMPVYTPGKTATVTKTGPSGTSYSTIQIPGSTTYVPYAATVTDKWLYIRLVEGEDYRKEGKDNAVWIGEASITSEAGDIRELINYLIIGIYKYFGRNTGKTLSIDVEEDDPLIRRITDRGR